MPRTFIVIAVIGLALSACSLTPEGECKELGLSAGSAAYEQCVADKTAAARKNQFKRKRIGHGR